MNWLKYGLASTNLLADKGRLETKQKFGIWLSESDRASNTILEGAAYINIPLYFTSCCIIYHEFKASYFVRVALL